MTSRLFVADRDIYMVVKAVQSRGGGVQDQDAGRPALAKPTAHLLGEERGNDLAQSQSKRPFLDMHSSRACEYDQGYRREALPLVSCQFAILHHRPPRPPFIRNYSSTLPRLRLSISSFLTPPPQLSLQFSIPRRRMPPLSLHLIHPIIIRGTLPLRLVREATGRYQILRLVQARTLLALVVAVEQQGQAG